MANYGQAWEAGDAQGAADLFADEAAYRVTPFEEPLEGKEAIQAYWQAGPGGGKEDVPASLGIGFPQDADRRQQLNVVAIDVGNSQLE